MIPLSPNWNVTILEELGFTPDRLERFRRLPYKFAVDYLEALKVAAKRNYRQLVFKHHPDRNPNDPDAGAKLARLLEVMKQIEGLRVLPPSQLPFDIKPVPAPRVIHYYTPPTASKTRVYDARRVVFLRP
jgi:hypothetical protein